jgi:uncharacterized protein YndB with AHSA1/START domain
VHGLVTERRLKTLKRRASRTVCARWLWSALTNDVEFMRQYWFGTHCESQWTPGSSWKHVFDDGQILDAGEIVEADPPRRLVIRWQNQNKPERIGGRRH